MRDEELSRGVYSSIQDTQLKYWEKIRHPFVAGLELTPKCNLQCVHCYMKDYPTQQLLPTDKWKFIIDKLFDAGILVLYMTGGEILSRADFSDIYVYAKKKGFIIELLTNITMLTPEIVKIFEEYPPATVSISVYGISARTYERVTGIRGSFEKFLAGVNMLRNADLDMELKFIGLRENYMDFFEAEDFAIQNGGKFKYNFEIFPTLQGSSEAIKHRLANEEILSIETQYEQTIRVFANNICNDNCFINADKVPVFTCNVASTLCYIDSLGYVSPCNKMRLKSYNIMEHDLSYIWQKYIEEYAYMVAPQDYVCAKCPRIHICSPCPIINYLSTGSYTKPCKEYCELSLLRTEEFSKRKYDKYRTNINIALTNT
ncbi:MAG: radical SAM protein [Synergistaceae bacterium]|nr:radical SAM protein [Synergistaceae bacterium]